MTDSRRIDSRWWVGLGLALTVAKLWLSRGQGVYALGNAGHDDLLFVQLAQSIIKGDWLGPFNELTLAKGAAYPLFIAAAFAVGVPLFLAQQLFYATACALFVRSLRPAITSAAWRFAIFALLLCNPMTYEAPSMGRVLRQHIYGPLALLVMAGSIALYFRRQERLRRQLPWALVAGLAAGAFYLTREEIIWFFPSALLLAGAYAVGAWRLSAGHLRRAGLMLVTILVAAALPVLFVCKKNQDRYGWFGTNEFRSAEFQAAYGAMLRVQVGPEISFVPVTRAARSAMAGVSPAFAELQAKFEGGVAHGWAGASEFFTHLPPDQQEIGGGWFMWALRDATAQAGYYRDPMTALKFYKRLAKELNHAADTGQLPAGPARTGFVPPWRDDQTGPFVRTALEFSDFVVSWRHFSARPPPSSGAQENLQLFRDVTRERISPPEGELDVVGAARYILNLRKVEWLNVTGKALRPILFWLFVIAQIITALRLVQAIVDRSWSFQLTLAAAAWGACFASILMHAMIEVSSFPVRTVSSFAPIYPLLLVFIFAGLWTAPSVWTFLGSLRRRTAEAALRAPNVTPPAPHRTSEGSPATTRSVRWWPWLAGVVALTPFLFYYGRFMELFWFGDDLFLIDQIAAMGFVDWTTRVFAENFVPLFKFLWGGALLVSGGSYAAMLWLLWLTHALNTALLGRVLLRANFSLFATLAVQLVFGLSATNLETLGWSVQWSAVLATTFLLLGLLIQERIAAGATSTVKGVGLLMLCAAASACSFSRGVLTGPIFALGCLLPLVGQWQWRTWLRPLPAVVGCGLPSVAVALVIMLNSSGNHQQMSGHWDSIVAFAGSYFLFNPAYALTGSASVHPAALLIFGGLKLAVVVSALVVSRGRVRHFLVLLLAFDLGNALLIGIGRYHTGFMAALSSRYQYGSLLATLPAVAVVLEFAAEAFLKNPLARRRLALSSLAVIAGWNFAGWRGELATFIPWRGTELRQQMAAPATSDPSARVPALEFMHIERAKALQRAFDLH